MDTNTEATYTNTGCEGEAVRPVLNCRKGDVRAAFPIRTANSMAASTTCGPFPFAVEIVCQSPTGDQSDSWTLHLPCSTAGQAESVAAMWRKAWDIPAYGNSASMTGR
jgi:hypothetical protein